MYLDEKYYVRNNQKASELFKKACDMNLSEACTAYDNLNK
jgi:uncharacterized protein